ncbi:hypothetical protein [Streptomyces sp. NPDC088707]|uniref:hypothetical protein n=1 Tax=Streptomyces sp. NPDC088707 TaxID=3365871 RepID=UPI0037F80BB5
MTSQEVGELDEQFEVVVGRKAPFSMVPDWVTLFPGSKSHPKYRGKILSPTAKAVYAVLAMHVNVARGDSTCWPSRKSIAGILGFSREQSVDPYLKELDAADAIDREPMTRPNGCKGVRYVVHQMPPAGYDGEETVGQHYKNRRDEEVLKMSAGPGRPRKEPDAQPVSEPADDSVETEADAGVRAVAERWWAEAQELVTQGQLAPLATDRQTERAKANLTQRIRDAFAAGHDTLLIEMVLRELGQWGPAKSRFESTLKRMQGKTPEELALDKQAQLGAKKWWEEAEKLVAAKKMGPLMSETERQRTGYFHNLRTKIRAALAAGYDSRQIWKALGEIGEWSPAKREFDRALRRVSGVRTPGPRDGRAPLFTNDQWKRDPQDQSDGTPASPSAGPDLSAFGIQIDAPI